MIFYILENLGGNNNLNFPEIEKFKKLFYKEQGNIYFLCHRLKHFPYSSFLTTSKLTESLKKLNVSSFSSLLKEEIIKKYSHSDLTQSKIIEKIENTDAKIQNKIKSIEENIRRIEKINEEKLNVFNEINKDFLCLNYENLTREEIEKCNKFYTTHIVGLKEICDLLIDLFIASTEEEISKIDSEEKFFPSFLFLGNRAYNISKLEIYKYFLNNGNPCGVLTFFSTEFSSYFLRDKGELKGIFKKLLQCNEMSPKLKEDYLQRFKSALVI